MRPRFPAFAVLLWLLGLVVAVGLFSHRAQGQFGGGAPHLTPALIADTSAVTGGQPFTVGLHLKMDPGWHTYWEYPGVGTPVTAAWKLPQGWHAGPIQWPLPQSHFDPDLEETSYIYENEVFLLVEITPPAQVPAGGADLKADLKWQVCEKVCLPGSGSVSLHLAAGAPAPSPEAPLIATWRSRLPQSNPPFPVKWDFSDSKQVKLTLGKMAAPAGQVAFYPLPPAGVAIKDPVVTASADGVETVIIVALAKPGPPESGWRGVIVSERREDRQEGWLVTAPPTGNPPPAGAADTAPNRNVSPLKIPLSAPRSLLGVLLLAFVGGLILNVMPCVLPVIALKIFGFVRQAGQEPARVFRLGLAFVAGVFAFFLLLALAVSLLKVHYGFQFQNPYLRAVLIAIVFVFGLNLLGVFEISLGGEATSKLSELSAQEGYGGAFLHGLFTTLLGTSCTAPFLAGSLGYTVTQPAPIVVLIYLTAAAGMSLPYFLLTLRPNWIKRLPKPGLWMDRFKQIMGFIMLAFVVFLFAAFAKRGFEAVFVLSWYLFALAFACWLLGALAHRSLAVALALVIAVGGYFGLLHGRLNADRTVGENFEAALTSAVQGGGPVFVDFTADWCFNCKVFEKKVLEQPAIQSAFEKHHVTFIKADWTDGDPIITKYLNQFGGDAVPLYVLYRPGEPQPVVMAGLTQQLLLDHLAALKAVD